MAGNVRQVNVSDDLFTRTPYNATTMESWWVNVTANYTNTTLTEKKDCQVFLFILYAILGILCLFGFFGNLLSFLVLRKDTSSPVASFLLQMLAIADNSFLAIWMFIYSFRVVFNFLNGNGSIAQQNWYLYARVYSFPIMYMAQMATIWLTVVIALNRFMAVCLPYRAPTLCTIYNVYKEVICVAIFSIAYNIPRFLEVQLEHNDDGQLAWNYTELYRNNVYQTLYSHTLYYMFTFVMPVLILTLVNTKVIIAYRATRRRRYRMTSRRTENESNITLVMIIVVVIFMICQAPARIVQIISNYNVEECEYLYYFMHISNTLEILNSSINFVVYFLFRKRFRDILHENFCIHPFNRTRSNSRVTTTEGLSLVEIERTNTNVNGSQRRGERGSPSRSQAGSIRVVEKNHAAAIVNASVPNNHVPVNNLHKSDEQLQLVQNQV